MRFDHGGSPSSAIDASVNINPLGAPASLDAVFARARSLAQRYPEPDARSARCAWAQRLGVPVERLLIGNGASELISLAVRALAPRRVIVFDPCYSEYETAAAAAGCTVEHMALQRENGSWRTPRYLPAMCEDDLVVVAQPNNPTGHFTPRDHLLSMAAGGCNLMVDESFLALSADPVHGSTLSAESLVPDARGSVCVIASLTKTFCVPGLRLGYVVADESWIGRMSDLREPWSVNGIAAEAAVSLATDQEHVERSRTLIATERRRLARGLARIPGLHVMEGCAPWVLAELPEPFTAAAVRSSLLGRGIAIRDASTFRGLGERWIRVGVRTPDENGKVAEALAVLLS